MNKISNDNIQNSSLLNYLNDLRNQLNTISISQHEFTKDIKQCISQCNQLINKYSKIKSNEYLNKIKEDIDHLTNLIHNFNLNNYYIKQIKQNLNKYNQSIIPIKDSSSLLKPENDSSKECYSYHFSLSSQNSFYPYLISPKEILNIRSLNWYAFATNENHLLVIGKSKIYLFNKNLKILHEKYFFHQDIKDICWSKTLNRFIFISSKQIYTFNEKQMIIQPYKLYFNINQYWQRGTCSENNLFLSTFGENPYIIQFNFNPTIHFYKKYQNEIISNKNQIINDIKYHSNNLAIIIENNLNNQTYFQLHSLKYFQLIWKILLGNGWNYRSTLFNYRYWIISDYYNNRLIFILDDGIIIKTENYFSKPENIISWNHNQILIRTIDTINIHQSQ